MFSKIKALGLVGTDEDSVNIFQVIDEIYDRIILDP